MKNFFSFFPRRSRLIVSSLQLPEVQIERQKHNRKNYSDDGQRGDGEERQLRDGREAELEDALGDGNDVVLPLDCHAVGTREV